jgi:CspA family cold shock protein
MSDRSTGSVKWFNNKAGYGFVTVKGGDHDGKDVFAHYSAIKVADDQFRYLVQGEYIEFDLTKDESGKHDFVVSNISGIKGGSLMCEVQKANEKPRETRVVYKYVVGESGDKASGDAEGFQTTRRRMQKPKSKPNDKKSYLKAVAASN